MIEQLSSFFAWFLLDKNVMVILLSVMTVIAMSIVYGHLIPRNIRLKFEKTLIGRAITAFESQRLKKGGRIISLIFPIITTVTSILTVIISIISGDTVPSDQVPRELIIVTLSLLLIIACSALTIFFTPSRMTVIAGISIGLIAAVVLVEAFLWVNDYMNERILETQDVVVLKVYRNS